MIIAYLIHRRPTSVLRADPLGKLATIIQFVAVATLVAAPRYAWPIAVAAGAIGVAAAIHYAAREYAA